MKPSMIINIEQIKVIHTNDIVRKTDQGWTIDTRKIVNEDVYYAFNLGNETYFAKKFGNTVRVYEVIKINDRKVVLIPLFEVTLQNVLTN